MMNKFGKISLYATGLLLPLPFFVGTTLGYVLKSSNPNNVDITNGLAYLANILITSIIILGILWAIALIAGILGIKKDQDKTMAKTSLMILALASALIIGYATVNMMTEQLKTNYTQTVQTK